MKPFGVIALGLFGVVLLVAGIVFPIVFPNIMAKKLDKMLLLSPDSPTISNFISPPVPIYMQYYFFNVTNPNEILEGERAVLNQMGPFSYLEKRLKYDLLWEDTDSTVTFKQNKTFFFRPDMSNGLTEDTEITVLNPVLIALAAKLSGPVEIPQIANGIFEILRLRYDVKPFITKKASELLFGGYQEDLFSFLAPLTGDPAHKDGKFGFFYPKNDSNDGTYRVGTGGDGMENIQIIQEWKGEPQLDFWKTDSCNMINGTEGSQFPRPITPSTNIQLYSSDLCRSLSFKFEKYVMHGGLQLNRYVLPMEVLAKTPENDCFCTDEFTCRDSMVNLGPCKKGTPIIASTPHFYQGTYDTISAVDGLSPNKEEHETFLDIEPNTGVAFQAHKRIQISLPLRRYESMSDFAKVQEVILPILWLNESVVVPVERAAALHSKLTVPLLAVRYICLGLLALGGLMLLLSVIFAIKACRTPKTDSSSAAEASLSRGNKPPGKSPGKDGKKDAVNEYDRTEAYKHLFS